MTGPIYTRHGDAGETSLADGSRVAKDDPRVVAYGTIDEANSHIGLARAALDDPALDGALAFVQQRLFNCSSNLATPPTAVGDSTPTIAEDDVVALEHLIDRFTEATGELDHFVVPGGCEAAARLHVARTVARRAEREIRTLTRDDAVNTQVLAFVNRLSDLLFSAARYANHLNGVSDAAWDPQTATPTADDPSGGLE